MSSKGYKVRNLYTQHENNSKFYPSQTALCAMIWGGGKICTGPDWWIAI